MAPPEGGPNESSMPSTTTSAIPHLELPRPRLRRSTLLGLFLLAVALRWLRFEISPVLSVDGTTFLHLAELWLAGRPAEALAHDFHPLYSALIAAGGWLGLDLESAGLWIAHLSSAALVVPVGFAAARLAGPVAGTVAGLLVACDPYLMRFGADVLSDSLCVALWISALAIGIAGIERRRARLCLLAGLSSGLAYLTRPEGGEAAVVLLLLLSANLFGVDRPARRTSLLCGLALVGGLALCAAPYLTWLSLERGGVTLSQKKDVVGLASGLTSGPLEGQSVLAHLFSTLFPTYALLAVIGFLARARVRGRWWWATLLTTVLHLMLLVGLARTHGYVSRRHIAPILALSAPWAACGLLWLQARLRWPRPAALRLAALLALTLVPALIKNARPTRSDKRVLAEMGRRIAREHGIGRTLATTRPRVAHYARAEWRALEPEAEQPVFDAELLVLTEEERSRGWDRSARRQGYVLVLELGEGDRRLSLWVQRR